MTTRFLAAVTAAVALLLAWAFWVDRHREPLAPPAA